MRYSGNISASKVNKDNYFNGLAPKWDVQTDFLVYSCDWHVVREMQLVTVQNPIKHAIAIFTRPF